MSRLLPFFSLLFLSSFAIGEVIFPKTEWQKVEPESVGLRGDKLEQWAKRIGGDGCVIRNGCLAYSWGDIKSHRDWASAAKPVLSTMLLLAVHNQHVTGVRSPVAQQGWSLRGKDAGITFLQLANMTSGYARGEPPDTAWAYNDVGVELYARSLERAFQSSLDDAARRHLAPLQFQDGTIFESRHGRGVVLSVRDMARLGWFWLNEGRWDGQKLIANRLFTRNVRSLVSANLPQSETPGQDYLGIGSYGGGSKQTSLGPGIYGFSFWFNTKLPNGDSLWPSAPKDTYQANGYWNRHTVTVIPSLKIVVVVSGADRVDKFQTSSSEQAGDKNMRLLLQAVMPRRSGKS